MLSGSPAYLTCLTSVSPVGFPCVVTLACFPGLRSLDKLLLQKKPDYGALYGALYQGTAPASLWQESHAVAPWPIVDAVAMATKAKSSAGEDAFALAVNELAECARRAHEGHAELICLPMVSEEGARSLMAMSKASGTDKPAELTASGVKISAAKDERCRLIYGELPQEPHLSLHMLISIGNPLGVEPVLALRFLHGNDDEELVLAFSSAGLVIAGQLERPVQWIGHLRLLSLHLDDGRMRVDLDGIPIWFAERRSEGRPTGFNLDLIGAPAGDVSLEMHWLEVFRRLGPIDQNDAALALPRGLIAAHLSARDFDALSLDLHGFAALQPLGPDDLLSDAVVQLGEADGAYRSHVAEALIDHVVNDALRADLGALEPPPPVVQVSNVGVRLSANAAGDKSLFGLMSGRVRQEIEILDGVDFTVYPGDIVGIIGKNGAGKTTLLHAITGAMPISSGRIGVRGKPILLRPGAGMQAELTGRENIFQAGLYMGLTLTKIRDIMDDVIEFSELRDHIDRPYQYYSDGMRSRLIFSMATAISPEILMLDELLSAGDIGFQKKALKRLDEFIGKARVVMVVQHGLDFVLSRCTKCLYLKNGRQVYYGDPRIASKLYQSDL